MTPHQFAHQFCANFDPEGCAALGITDAGQTIRLWPRRPACTITTERCSYFETCVAPHIRTMPEGPHRDSWLEAIALYLRRLPPRVAVQAKVNIFGKAPDEKIDNLPPSRKCPNCGKPMQARRRLCETCVASKRRETYRLANGRRAVPQYNS